jgi:MFS family permease
VRERRLWPRGGLWRHGDFLKLWSAETVSQLGTQVSQLALPLAAILVLDASAFQVAFLTTVEFLPFVLLTLPAGVWVDRMRRRPILVAADLGRGLLLASIPLAHAFGQLTIWQLYVVGFGVGVGTVFFDVSYQSYLPSLVDRKQLVEGNSKLEVSRSGALIAGPGLAGALVGAITAPYAILVDAVSFLGSAAFLFRIRAQEERVERSQQASMLRELKEGLRYLLGHRYWRPFAICTGTSNFFGQVGFSIFLVYAVRELELSPQLIGLSLIPLGAGGLAAALFAGRLSARFGVGPTIIGSAAVFGPASLLVPLAPASFPIPFFAASFALLGATGIVYNITGISLVQTITPERLLGRLNASRRFLVWGTIPLGALTGGALASVIGLRPTLWVGAAGSCLCFLPILLSPLRKLRDMPTEQEPDPTAPPVPAAATAFGLDA